MKHSIYPSIIGASLLLVASLPMHAQLAITTPGTPTFLDFESTIPDVFRVYTGTPSPLTRSLVEPGVTVGTEPRQALVSSTWAIKGSFINPSARGNGTASFFGNYNNDSDLNDVFNAGPTSSTPIVVPPGSDGDNTAPTNALRIARDSDFAVSSVFLRIQNNTGIAINSWDIGFDLFYKDTGTSQFSVVQLQYASASATDLDPDALSWTTYGTPPAVTQSATVSFGGSISETIGATIAPGNFLVLAFRDTASSSDGSTVLVDNISITAVPEPATYALLGGLALIGMTIFRRRK